MAGWRVAVVVPFAACIVASCDSTVATEPLDLEPGYDFTLEAVGPAVVYRWPSSGEVRFYAAPSGDRARDRLLEGALEHAVLDWADAMGPEGPRLRVTRRREEADVVVQWSDAPSPLELSGCPPRVTGRAATTFCPNPGGDGLRPYPWASDGAESGVRMVVTILGEEATGETRVRQLVGHELGHALGIGRHSPDPGDLMWGGPLQTVRPSAADRATVRRLYRTAPTLRP